MAIVYNIAINQGADWFFNLDYENPAGTPVNLTGYSAAIQLKRDVSSASAVLTLTQGSGITITGPAGALAFHATAAQTAAIASGGYYYDLKITSSGGIVTRLIQGLVQVNASITNV